MDVASEGGSCRNLLIYLHLRQAAELDWQQLVVTNRLVANCC